MRILLSYPTEVGIFEIGQSPSKQYHPIFDDTPLGNYNSIQEAVNDLVKNSKFTVNHPDTNEQVNTSDLGMPEDYTHWDSGY